MASPRPEPLDRRVGGRWDQLSTVTGVSLGGTQTGWDRLVQQLCDDPDVRLKAVRRMEAIVSLCRLLTRLSDTHFIVLALRLGLTVDDQDIDGQSRRQVSERLRLSVSRIAQLEQEAVVDLRRRAVIEFPSMAAYVHRSTGSGQWHDTGRADPEATRSLPGT
jgi:hypothetical protein